VLTDVPLAASNDDGKIVLQQEYSVEFQDVSNSPRNLANLINRSKSGNPGYIYGRPVLAGHAIAATSQLDAVSPRARGLQLLGADNDGTCTDAATERAKHPESRSLNVLHHYYKGHLIFWGGHAVRVSTSAKLQPGTRLLCRSRSARHGECCPVLACVPVLLTHKMSSPGAILTSQTYLMPTKSEYPTHSRRPVFRVSCLNNCNCIDWAIRQCRPARCITVGQCRRATHDRCSSLAGADLDMRKCSDFNELSFYLGLRWLSQQPTGKNNCSTAGFWKIRHQISL